MRFLVKDGVEWKLSVFLADNTVLIRKQNEDAKFGNDIQKWEKIGILQW